MRVRGGKFYSTLLSGAAFLAFAGIAHAEVAEYKIPPQPLDDALQAFSRQSGHPMIVDMDLVRKKKSPGAVVSSTPEAALRKLLAGTGLDYRRDGEVFAIVVAQSAAPIRLAPAPAVAAAETVSGSAVEGLVVTAQKRRENIQDVPIAISAFTQDKLEVSQIAGGPDLMTQVPNMTFTKTNFSGYSIQIRGIGTQAISATTDAAVAVAFNNTPFIRNRFFEQEFYDLQRVEVLRGPQGTLYGRNATAGVVNIISARPAFDYEAKLSGDVANYSSSRLEGMINLPLVEDTVALRVAAAWTKRDGYVDNEITGNPIDGRDLWSMRTSLRVAPTDWLDVNLIWEHFEENDDRLRSGKQLCHQDDRDKLGNLKVYAPGVNGVEGTFASIYSNVYSQGCLPASLYSPDSLEAPNGFSLPYYLPLSPLYVPLKAGFNPYASLVQSSDLRVIESTVDPRYQADSDLVELQWSADLGDSLTLASETSYLYDTIFSLQDYNRFNTARGAFVMDPIGPLSSRTDFMEEGEFGAVFCDPQVGCADRVVAVDVSRAKSSQFSQEFRLSSDYEGPFNFSLGANFLRYDTEDKYYVFINTLTLLEAMGAQNGAQLPAWEQGVSDNRECLTRGLEAPDLTTFQNLSGCSYIDPNPIENVNDMGHNYFLSKNPYKLLSYAVFGETYYNITSDLKLTAGLRWTLDKKEAPRIPSMLLAAGAAGFSVLEVEEQEWSEPTGRLAIDWKPDLAFTDDTLLYASYAHGYKAGGSNPPPSSILAWALDIADLKFHESVVKPKIFDPEFVDAFEIGAKNTFFDGALTLNTAAFYYDYEGYQVSQIIDRSAVNYNFDATVWGLELEADWAPLENLRFGFKGGYENTRVADGERAIDIMERNAGHGPDSEDPWVVVRPFPTYPSNCVVPLAVFDQGNGDEFTNLRYPMFGGGNPGPCEIAYTLGVDPVTFLPYVPNPTVTLGIFGDLQPIENPDLDTHQYINYPGFDPLDESQGHNHGEGFFKELGGNELPNAPHFTGTVTADYTIPLPSDWLMTLHTDLYYQSEAWTRVFNMDGYDKLKAYYNVNLAAIFTNEDAGWKVMAYIKNVMDRDSITGAFLNSDDSGLTTNIFLTEPRLYGVRVTKDWSGGPWWTGAPSANHEGPYPLTIELSGQVQRHDAPYASVAPDFVSSFSDALDPTSAQHQDLDWGDGRQVRITYRPDAGEVSVAAALRYGRTNSVVPNIHASEDAGPARCIFLPDTPYGALCDPENPSYEPAGLLTGTNWSDASAQEKEQHVIADFTVGRDFGLGSVGDSHSTFSAGLRFAQFESTTRAQMDGIPDWDISEGWAKYPASRNHYRATVTADREFNGFGPTISWDAAQILWGDEKVGHLDLDWSVTGGVVFGKQKTTLTGTEEAQYQSAKYSTNILPPLTVTPVDIAPRRTSVNAPLIDLSAGLSYELQRFKVGAGYRWERYFGVLDGGYAEHKDYDRTIEGPYFKVAVGFGG